MISIMEQKVSQRKSGERIIPGDIFIAKDFESKIFSRAEGRECCFACKHSKQNI